MAFVYIHIRKWFSYPPIEFSPRIQEKKLGIRKIFLHGFVFSIHGFEFPLTVLSFHSRVYSWGVTRPRKGDTESKALI